MVKRRNSGNKKHVKAFNAVLDEYLRRHEKTLLPPLDLSIPRGNTDPLKPSDPIFFADCALAWESKIDCPELLLRFIEHYLQGEDELSEGEQRALENKIGREFIRRQIFPLREYWNVVKK